VQSLVAEHRAVGPDDEAGQPLGDVLRLEDAVVGRLAGDRDVVDAGRRRALGGVADPGVREEKTTWWWTFS